MDEEKYLPELMAEKDSLEPTFQHTLRLLSHEIQKIQRDEEKEEGRFIDVIINKNMKMGQKVLIPVKQFPNFNFVGKLLGPRGNSLKRLQEETLTKMSILGKGSMRDREKEEELRNSGELQYLHLMEDLHVLIEVFAPPAEAYARMGHALDQIKKFLIPDHNDEIRQAQLQELTYLKEAEEPAMRASSTQGRAASGPQRWRGGGPLQASILRGVARGGARGAPPLTGYRAPPLVVLEQEYGDGSGTAYDSSQHGHQENSDDDVYSPDIRCDSLGSYGQDGRRTVGSRIKMTTSRGPYSRV